MQVLFVLMGCQLRPGLDFRIDGPCLPDPPTHFTLPMGLAPHIVRRLQDVPDISIAPAHAA
jgi:hypothetical protein